MTKEELNTHIEKRYSECCKRSQGLSYGSFYDGYVDCYCEQQKQVTELEDKLANADYQIEGRDLKIKDLEAQIEKMKYALNKIIKTVHDDNISGYGERLVIIYDISCEVLEEIKENE